MPNKFQGQNKKSKLIESAITKIVRRILEEKKINENSGEWDADRVKDELPPIQAKLPNSKKVVTAKIYGRRNDFATVVANGIEAEFSWKTLAKALNGGYPIQL